MAAAATRNREWHDDTVADLEFFHLTTDLHNFAHELMAKDIAFLHGRHIAIVEMQVRSANGGGCDFHNAIARIQNARIVDLLHLNGFFPHPTRGFHDVLFLCGWPAGCPSVVEISPASIK